MDVVLVVVVLCHRALVRYHTAVGIFALFSSVDDEVKGTRRRRKVRIWSLWRWLWLQKTRKVLQS